MRLLISTPVSVVSDHGYNFARWDPVGAVVDRAHQDRGQRPRLQIRSGIYSSAE